MRCLRTNLTIPLGGLMWKVNRMITRKIWLVFLLIAAATPAARAQINCTASGGNSGKLSCLIPTAVTLPGYTFSNLSANPQFQNSFGFLTADVGGEISQIPLASPASGIIFTIDPTLKVPVPSDQSLGPILTQRADTIGRHKLYLAATYQYFLLEDVDGLSLKNIPAVFSFNSNSPSETVFPDTVGVTNGRIDLKIHQFVGYVTYGLTSRIDISAAIPILRVDMRYTVNEELFTATGGGTNLQTSKAEEANGIGDVILAIKGNLWKLEKGGGLAIGAELRLPSGDAANFLGSGTIGGKPFAAFTYGGRVSPHANIAYQINGNTKLVTGANGGNGPLPDRLIYSGGADWRVAPRLTIAADILEQRVINAQRVTLESKVPAFPNNPSSTLIIPSAVATTNGSYNRTDGSIGLKVKPFGNLIVTGNLLVKLDQGGLRQRLAPMIGLSYSF
jgi:hypothetical protein